MLLNKVIGSTECLMGEMWHPITALRRHSAVEHRKGNMPLWTVNWATKTDTAPTPPLLEFTLGIDSRACMSVRTSSGRCLKAMSNGRA